LVGILYVFSGMEAQKNSTEADVYHNELTGKTQNQRSDLEKSSPNTKFFVKGQKLRLVSQETS